MMRMAIAGLMVFTSTLALAGEYCRETKPMSWYTPIIQVTETSLPLSIQVDYDYEQFDQNRRFPFFINHSSMPFYLGTIQKNAEGHEIFVAREKYVNGQGFIRKVRGENEWFLMTPMTRLYGLFFAEGISRANTFATFEPMPKELPKQPPQEFMVKAKFRDQLMDIGGVVSFQKNPVFKVRKEICMGGKRYPFEDPNKDKADKK